ncbi:DUF1192 domain-containing protein [Croceibacterium ferulae]|uniref:DUF1192 domain-containing protein n=1 Tax=Croceibacterium ferulae TaxID=1854641 RepID=UPI000EB49368|nr:DUF1192 domain-containing protein [Croceibacterium ferulae]
MDDESPLLRGPGHPLGHASLLAAEPLDRYSQDELTARIAALEAEIARVQAHADKAADHRRLAESIFSSRQHD